MARTVYFCVCGYVQLSESVDQRRSQGFPASAASRGQVLFVLARWWIPRYFQRVFRADVGEVLPRPGFPRNVTEQRHCHVVYPPCGQDTSPHPVVHTGPRHQRADPLWAIVHRLCVGRRHTVAPILYVLQLDERGRKKTKFRCKHANFIFKTEVSGEMEFLFSAYSAFKVDSSYGARYRCAT